MKNMQSMCSIHKLEQHECLHSENIPCCPMITRTIDSYLIPFIPSQNYVV